MTPAETTLEGDIAFIFKLLANKRSSLDEIRRINGIVRRMIDRHEHAEGLEANLHDIGQRLLQAMNMTAYPSGTLDEFIDMVAAHLDARHKQQSATPITYEAT